VNSPQHAIKRKALLIKANDTPNLKEARFFLLLTVYIALNVVASGAVVLD